SSSPCRSGAVRSHPAPGQRLAPCLHRRDNTGMKSGTDERGASVLLGAIIVGGVALFCLDVYLPLGIGNGVLYGGLVILSFLLPHRKGPIVTAAVCSALDLSDLIWAPMIEG